MERTSQDVLNELTVANLKEIARRIGQSASGTKAELVTRILSADGSVLRGAFEHVKSNSSTQRLLSPDSDAQASVQRVRPGEEMASRSEEIVEDLNHLVVPPELMARELEMLRREKALLERELSLVRREARMSPSVESGADSAAELRFNVQTIGDMVSEFRGDCDNFDTWKRQIELLRATYRLDENSTKILISLRLKSKALNWFHSKPEHLELNTAELFHEMSRIFGNRPSRLTLRKDFERRKWRSGEAFSEYFHEKVVLANKASIDEEELIDCLIDGVPDARMRSQARMLRFSSTRDLLDAFRGLSLSHEQRGNAERSPREQRPVMSSRMPREGETSTTRSNAVRCYNCGTAGHLSRDCGRERRREKGSCFRCGSSEHRIRDCPKLRPRTENTASVIQVTSPNAPYLVTLSYQITDELDNKCKYSLVAMIDSGSPISLIRSDFVPAYVCTPVTENQSFYGINGTKLKILGNFVETVEVNDVKLKINFFVVPNTAITCAALLGRDFTSSPFVKISLGGNFSISRADPQSIDNADFSKQILHISYVDHPSSVAETLNINPNLDFKTMKRIEQLYESEYIIGTEDINPPKEIEMTINLTHDRPISFRPRRLSFADKEKLRQILDKLLSEQIIRPSDSPYAFPIVLTHKKNGESRLCVDYRDLNKITVRDNFPTPLIDDHLDRLRDKSYFSSLDLRDGFHHVKVVDESIKYTSFVTPLGQFEFLRMPFGLTNAPRVFQRYVNDIFRDLVRADKVLIYLDDILIATQSIDEHLEILSEVFNLARRHKLRFRLDKCSFLYREIVYLGYLINESGIRPSTVNVESVINFPIPRNTREVHRFVCLASYFRRFIKNFSIIAKPLYDLVRKNATFQFGPEQNRVFELLKKMLSTQPILAIYSPKLLTELHCDASASGFGAILLQKQNDGTMRPVSYFSRRTTNTEARYHSFELECLAAVYAIKRFHIYLSGIPFTIVTDCNSFRLTLSKQTVNPRIYRWAMLLQNYDFKIEHRPGERMSHVDALSRCNSVLVLEANTFEQTLSIRQDKDKEICEIRDKLEKTEDKFYELRDGLVYRKYKDKKLLFYVPKCMESNVIRTCHDCLGHLGVDKVIDNITKVYWFPNLREKVRDYISNCLKCIEFSPTSGKLEGYLHSIPKGKLPFQTVHVDHYGPLEKSGKGYRYVLSLVDGFTKFIKLYPCKSTKTEEVIRHLKDYFRAYSKPRRLVSDRGTCFTSQLFAKFTKEESIQHILIAVGTPRANGQVERFNRVITPTLAKLCDAPEKWDTALGDVEFSLNNTRCRSTGNTPSQLLFGIDQIGSVKDEIRVLLDPYSENDRDLLAIRDRADNIIEASQRASEIHYNNKRKRATLYKEGDYVMICNTDVTPGVNKKLIPKFKGPYIVKTVLDNDRYIVSDIEGFQLTQLPYTGTVSADHMKMYVKE